MMTGRNASQRISTLFGAVVLTSLVTSSLRAQARGPDDIVLDPARVTAIAYANVLGLIGGMDSVKTWHLAINDHLVMRHDSVRAVADSLAGHWLTALRARPMPWYQDVPLLNLIARTGDLTAVEHSVTTLLATRGMTDTQRAWVLNTAISALIRSRGDTMATPEAVQLARRYDAQLATLPVAIAPGPRIDAFCSFMHWEWWHHHLTQAMADGWQAHLMWAKTPSYRTREEAFLGSIAISGFAALLAGQPNGRVAIDSLVRLLQRGLALSPAEAAQDPALKPLAAEVQGYLAGYVAQLEMYGKPAPPIIATHWFAQPTPATVAPAELAGKTGPAAHLRMLNDGKVHIIEYGFLGCPYSPVAARQILRDWASFPPNVDIQYYLQTAGAWGGTLVEPDIEAQHLYRHYAEVEQMHFPITIWAGAKVPTPDGGMLPEPSPTIAAYKFSGCPTWVVVDGHGLIRWRAQGAGQMVELLKAFVTLLAQEHASATPAMAH